jgi:hypothetical protein
MKKVFHTIALAVGLLGAATASYASPASICDANTQNLVSNCGFETGGFSSWTLTGNDVPGEAGSLYGVEGTDPYPLPNGTDPHSGTFQAYFSDLAANATSLSQTLSTVVGDTYLLTFDMAQYLVGPGTVTSLFNVSFGGLSVLSLSDIGEQGYTAYSLQATATSSSSVLSFTMGNDIGEFLLDDVSVSAVPEPSSIALLSVGLLGVRFAKSRRRSDKT